MHQARKTAIAAFAACSFAASGAAPAYAGCDDADSPPEAIGIDRYDSALHCLINAQRDHRGLKELDPSPKLARAALAHTESMIEDGNFGHGSNFRRRIERTGYGKGTRFIAGENIAAAAGEAATARGIVSAWMHSAAHRKNILYRRFRDLGVAAQFGAPAAGEPGGVTITTDFGAKRK